MGCQAVVRGYEFRRMKEIYECTKEFNEPGLHRQSNVKKTLSVELAELTFKPAVHDGLLYVSKGVAH